MLAFCEGGLGFAKLVEVTLRIQGRHAAGAGASDGLAVDVVLHIARSVNAGDIGRGGIAGVTTLGNDSRSRCVGLE